MMVLLCSQQALGSVSTVWSTIEAFTVDRRNTSHEWSPFCGPTLSLSRTIASRLFFFFKTRHFPTWNTSDSVFRLSIRDSLNGLWFRELEFQQLFDEFSSLLSLVQWFTEIEGKMLCYFNTSFQENKSYDSGRFL